MINIGIVGLGFVGKAVEHGFKTNNNIFIADPKLGSSTKDLLDKKLDVIFICAPTPMSDTGEINSSIVEQILVDLEPLQNTLIVLKSTVTPTIVDGFAQKYLNFVYNPEFLTERNALNDFVNPIHQVFGGLSSNTKKLAKIYEENSSCADSPVFHMTAKEASFVKYGMNTFLTAKVLFWNQFYDLCQASGANYNSVIAAVGNDKRIGISHTMVPGLDGRRGYSGSCFPKDAQAFAKFSDNKLTLLVETILRNNEYQAQYALSDREKEQNVSYKINP